MTPEERRTLTERVLAGDPNALNQFLHEYRKPLLRHIRIELRRRGMTHPSEEVEQSIFLSAICSFLSRLSKPSSNLDAHHLLAYVKTIATHKLIDRARRDGKQQAGRLSEIEEPPHPVNSLLRDEIMNEQREWLYQEIRSLPPQHQEILERRLQGQTHQEIGEALNLREPQVRRLWQTITTSLRCRAGEESHD
jgi:RNA polymerase sigma factor (sigma-70 family)